MCTLGRWGESLIYLNLINRKKAPREEGCVTMRGMRDDQKVIDARREIKRRTPLREWQKWAVIAVGLAIGLFSYFVLGVDLSR